MQAKVSGPSHSISPTCINDVITIQKWSQAHSNASLHSSDSIPVLHSITPVQHSSPLNADTRVQALGWLHTSPAARYKLASSNHVPPHSLIKQQLLLYTYMYMLQISHYDPHIPLSQAPSFLCPLVPWPPSLFVFMPTLFPAPPPPPPPPPPSCCLIKGGSVRGGSGLTMTEANL